MWGFRIHIGALIRGLLTIVIVIEYNLPPKPYSNS